MSGSSSSIPPQQEQEHASEDFYSAVSSSVYDADPSVSVKRNPSRVVKAVKESPPSSSEEEQAKPKPKPIPSRRTKPNSARRGRPSHEDDDEDDDDDDDDDAKFDDDEEITARATSDVDDNASVPGQVVVLLTPELQTVELGGNNDIMVTLTAFSGSAQEKIRPGADIIAVIDRSGSMMSKRKMRNAIVTAKFIIDSVGPQDRVAIVGFERRPRRYLKLTAMSEQGKLVAHQAAEKLTASGGTDILRGLNMALKILRSRKHENSVSGIVLLTDGQDSTRIEQVRKKIKVHKLTGEVPIHTMAFGADHKSQLLREIAEETLGTYSYIEDAEGVSDAVAPAIAGFLSTIAKKVKVQVMVDQSVGKLEAVDSGAYKSEVINSHEAMIDAGQCYDGERRNFLVSVNCQQLPVHLTAKVSYVDARTNVNQELVSSVLLEGGEPGAESKNNADVSEFKLNVIFRKALKTAVSSRPKAAVKHLETALNQIESYPYAIPEDSKAELLEEVRSQLMVFKKLLDEDLEETDDYYEANFTRTSRSNQPSARRQGASRNSTTRGASKPSSDDEAAENPYEAIRPMSNSSQRAPTKPTAPASAAYDAYDASEAYSTVNAYYSEMTVQRAGKTAMSKSSYNKKKYATHVQAEVTESAYDYWEQKK